MTAGQDAHRPVGVLAVPGASGQADRADPRVPQAPDQVSVALRLPTVRRLRGADMDDEGRPTETLDERVGPGLRLHVERQPTGGGRWVETQVHRELHVLIEHVRTRVSGRDALVRPQPREFLGPLPVVAEHTRRS